MLRPLTAAGTAAHLVLGIAGATVALWAGGIWLVGWASIAAGYAADAVDGLGNHIPGVLGAFTGITVFLGGAIVVVGTPIFGTAFIVRCVEGGFRRIRQAGRP